jgi:hypothetical protein
MNDFKLKNNIDSKISVFKKKEKFSDSADEILIND